MRYFCSFRILLIAFAMSLAVATLSFGITPPQREFFESKIRPVLASECYECHSTAGKQRAGLVLDHRAALLKGGDSGAVVVPGKPEESLMITAIKHVRDDLKMPKAGVQLSASIVVDFEKWIAMGAPDPRDAPPSAAEVAAASDWTRIMEQRKQWWSFQPIQEIAVPSISTEQSAQNPIDQFLGTAQKAAGIEPVAIADRRSLIRRLSFVLTGFPPSPEEVEKFVNDRAVNAWEGLVDSMLGSPAFGERWARHWMDWFRYAETHGSEGDPAIPFAWHYRDYLIRALNDDVPYDQLVREHIAGDLLESPRIIDGRNESAYGTAHYRMVQHGFAPTDALDELVRFTDNQIDVVTKGFLGLTVSCARCHNHKFDAISQADFYAMFGIMASNRPATLSVNVMESTGGPRAVMRRMKVMIRERLVASWGAEPIVDHLLQPEASWFSMIENATQREMPLHAWNQLKDKKGEEFKKGWKVLSDAWKASAAELALQEKFAYQHRWKLSDADAAGEWFMHGTGAPKHGDENSVGQFHLLADGEQVVGGIFPGGLLSHALTTRDSAVFNSPKVMLDKNMRVFVRAVGSGQSIMRYVVQHYPRDGTVYPIRRMDDGKWGWQSWDLNYWKGDTVNVEVATAADSPVLGRANSLRSMAAVTDLIFVAEGEPTPQDHLAEHVAPLFEAAEKTAAPENAHELARLYSQAIMQSSAAWEMGILTDSQARFLDYFVSADLLPNTLDGLPSVAPLVMEFRELEQKLDDPARIPGIVEAEPVLQPLFERGDHKQPGEPVARRFLDAFGARIYPDGTSGRLELAEDIVDGNPLAARVIVNRLWHHVFGQGIVTTPDNFGRLGELPTHPELLDFLARRMRDGGWSMKRMLRLLVTSQAFQRSAIATEIAMERDPENALLSHWAVRRLEAEAIRDSILSVSGRLNPDQFGPPVGGDSDRRSVYVRVIRNALDPFLSVFDAPVPNSTQGARDASNVPAQSLTMMNDAFVKNAAREWASNANHGEAGARNVNDRIVEMFVRALGRSPSAVETAAAVEFVAATTLEMKSAQKRTVETQRQLFDSGTELAGILDPVRAKLLAEREQALSDDVKNSSDLKPLAAWDFTQGAGDQIGELNLTLKGGASIHEGVLKLDGKGGYAISSALQKPLSEKTLEVVVELANLEQKGGAALSLETQGGGVFDAIVFAERAARKWMAGSDGFTRTQDFAGCKSEEEAKSAPVCITIVYHSDGTIAGYRNGSAYGMSYRTGKLVTFAGGSAHVLLGLRHSPSGGGRLLAGSIHRARIFDRALTADEVAASASDAGLRNYVSAKQIDAALSPAQLQRRRALAEAIGNLESELKLQQIEATGDPLRPWVDLAHSILNLKEFIYLK
ncbi:MAG: hypothetical protein ACI9R3_001974 [Verrucomicrobiales bacterium]|jgi:hypothetical protein